MTAYFPLFARCAGYWKAALLGAMALLLGPLNAIGQASPFTQRFTSNPSPAGDLPFTSVGGGYFSTTGTAGLFGAFGVATSNTTSASAQLNFERKTFAYTSPSGNQFSFDLAALGSNGFNSATSVAVYLSINTTGAPSGASGAFPTTPQVVINSSSNNNGQTYNFGTQNTYSTTLATAYPSTSVGATITNASNTPVSRVVITLPNYTATAQNPSGGVSVAAQIVITTANISTILIDNVALTSNNSTPLPVELTHFEATTKIQGVRLDWATASEKNSDRFEIQRSATGEAYQTIGTVQGQGSSTSAHTYSFVDSRPLADQAYYRLRQLDLDGTASFSPVVSARALSGTEMAAYPNPSLGVVTLPAALGTAQYRIFNAMGQTLLTGKAAGNDRIDITSLPKGPFFLELTGETGRTTQRLVLD